MKLSNNTQADDKYAKSAAAKEKSDSIRFLSMAQLLSNGFPSLLLRRLRVPLHVIVFACFMLVSGFAFTLVGGQWNGGPTERFAGLQLEILGLVIVREKIKRRNSVSGISGMTFIMYAVVYICRFIVALPPWWSNDPGLFDKDFKMKNLDFDVTLGFCSFLLVLDILRSIFRTHHETYEADLDKLKAWYLIPACAAVALMIRPQFDAWDFLYAWQWSTTLYMDVLALMPQVAMMAMSGGMVQTPIAEFVAVTTIARCGDLLYSLIFLSYLAKMEPASEPYSYWLTVCVQLVHLALVADFMFYFFKARAGLRGKETDIMDIIDV